MRSIFYGLAVRHLLLTCTYLYLHIVLTLGFFAALCLGQNLTSKQQAQWCDSKAGMCFAINIPSIKAPDYFIAITAPDNVGYNNHFSKTADNSWASIGIGNKMPHSLMFIIAQNNDNVSLSVRMSEYDTPCLVFSIAHVLLR